MAVLKLLTLHRAVILSLFLLTIIVFLIELGTTYLFRPRSEAFIHKTPTLRNSQIWNVSKTFDPLLDDNLVYPAEIVPFIGKYLIAKADKCRISTKLVILVPSAPANKARRDAIRETWASIARSLKMPVFFLLGHSNQPKVMLSISEEDKLNDDIIQWSFVDSYNNLTIKSMLMLSWLEQECSHAEFALKADDDMDVKVVQLYDKLVLPVKGQEMVIYGKAWNNSWIYRGKSKFALPKEIHRHAKKWPLYNPAAYLMPRGVVQPLLKSAIDLLPGLFLEDLYITGFAAAHANVKIQMFIGCRKGSVYGFNCANILDNNCKKEKSQTGHDFIIRYNCNPRQIRRHHKSRSKSALNSI